VKALPDTHLLIWSAEQDPRLPQAADEILNDPANEIFFSVASIWEIAIKARLGRSDFQIDPDALARGLIANGFIELPITRQHALAVFNLPSLHKDPFDRILIAQATVENLLLLTVDRNIARYPGPIREL
jgi:PIN domain nuclease of toxin-antitoxin system